MVVTHELVPLVLLIGSNDDHSSRVAVYVLWAFMSILIEIFVLFGKQV
jgi:hypothetical protein